MKTTTIGLSAAAAALALVLGACGTSAASIADEACDLLKDASAAAEDGDFDALSDAREKLEALEEKADDAGVSDEDMQEAVEDKCGDLL